MNGRVAKAIRHEVYGDLAPGKRDYLKNTQGEVHADEKRKLYQQAKGRGIGMPTKKRNRKGKAIKWKTFGFFRIPFTFVDRLLRRKHWTYDRKKGEWTKKEDVS